MRSLPLILCLLAVGLSPVIGSQDSPQVRVPQEQLDARSFLYAVYPELRTKSLVIDIAPAGNGMALRIAEPLPSPLLQRDPPLDPLMVAVLEFDRHNTLSAFRATGRLLKSDDNGRLRERLRNARTPEAALDLIRFGGHLPKGGYDVQTNGRQSQAAAQAPAVHG
jgi:hypothetical protein